MWLAKRFLGSRPKRMCEACKRDLRLLSAHHCRSCGECFCNKCSQWRTPLPTIGFIHQAVRVCEVCFKSEQARLRHERSVYVSHIVVQDGWLYHQQANGQMRKRYALLRGSPTFCLLLFSEASTSTEAHEHHRVPTNVFGLSYLTSVTNENNEIVVQRTRSTHVQLVRLRATDIDKAIEWAANIANVVHSYKTEYEEGVLATGSVLKEGQLRPVSGTGSPGRKAFYSLLHSKKNSEHTENQFSASLICYKSSAKEEVKGWFEINANFRSEYSKAKSCSFQLQGQYRDYKGRRMMQIGSDTPIVHDTTPSIDRRVSDRRVSRASSAYSTTAYDQDLLINVTMISHDSKAAQEWVSALERVKITFGAKASLAFDSDIQNEDMSTSPALDWQDEDGDGDGWMDIPSLGSDSDCSDSGAWDSQTLLVMPMSLMDAWVVGEEAGTPPSATASVPSPKAGTPPSATQTDKDQNQTDDVGVTHACDLGALAAASFFSNVEGDSTMRI